MPAQLLLIALGTLASEDLTLAATGVLVAQGKLTFFSAVAACAFGIFAGDMLIFLAGRVVGSGVARWPVLARRLPARAVNRGSEWLNNRGLGVVFLSRFTPGLRLPTYFAAGMLHTRPAAFALYFLLAAAVWTPILVGASSWFSHGLLRKNTGVPAFIGAMAVLAAGVWFIRLSFDFARRRRMVGFVQRKLRWEFWPAWLAYLPLIPYFLYLAIRHRSLTLFTAANPGIPGGGFIGESKSAILRQLERQPGFVAEFELIQQSLSETERLGRARRFPLPFVLKPDIGERGKGVTIARSSGEMERYLAAAAGDTILQRYVPGIEFGIFYVRRPGKSKGQIFSLTEKHFPVVTGDGQQTLRDLILGDDRAVCQAATYFKLTPHPLDAVPEAGERVQLVELGSHCRGAIFLDGSRHITPALESAVERLSRAHPEFHLGRYDVRCGSIEDLRAGRFQVVELNGVSAEATHIYDPSVSLLSAYRTMFEQWRLAFEIGAANRSRGYPPMPLRSLVLAIVRGLSYAEG